MAGDIKERQTKHGKVYWVRVESPPGPDGKRKQKTLTAKSYKELERKQRDLLHQIDKGQYSVAPSKMTLNEFLDYYLNTIKGKRANTYKNYDQSAKAFRKYLGTALLSELRTDKVQRTMNDMSESGLKESTVFQRFQNFSAMMRYAVGIDYILKNPCNGVIVNKPEAEEKIVWNENQAKQFDRFLKATKMLHAVLYMLLLKTGARIGELLGLRWSDVDFEECTIAITRTAIEKEKGYNPPKTKNGVRKVLLDQGTSQMLMKHRVQQDKEKLLHGGNYNSENLVFCSQQSQGGRLSYRRALDAYGRIVKATGLPYIPPHRLRHIHATMLLKAKHPVKAVAERLGDDPVTIEKTYAHVLASMREEIVKSIEQMYEERP